MGTGQFSYALDTTGQLPANLIVGETHTVTAVNDRTYHFVIPTFAPFHANSVRLAKRVNGTLLPLVEGQDWQPSLQFQGASLATAHPIYGAFSFTDLQFEGELVIERYQTLGGEYTLDVAGMTKVIGEIVYNPRGLTWEQVTNLPKMFPPIDHPWQFNDLVGMSELLEGLTRLEDAILSKSSGSLDDHLRDFLNPHKVSKTQTGLGLVENFPPATITQAVLGTSNQHYMTPLTFRSALNQMGLLDLADVVAEFRAHLLSTTNPHRTDAKQVGRGNVEDLQLATSREILAKAKVNKYITLASLIEYMGLHGCGTTADAPAPAPKDSLLSSYCSNSNKMGVYADGNGRTYEKVMEVNSRDCGYVPPAPNPTHPQLGTILNKYCVGKDQYATYADGYGGSYTRQIAVNSVDCGATPAPSGSPCPAAGTILNTRCEGTTQVKTLANGSCGSYEERVSKSDNCKGNVVHPDKGILQSTFCSGYNQMGKYTDGNGGTYDAVIKLNSTDCGYSAPVPTPAPTPAPAPAPINPVITLTKKSKVNYGDADDTSATLTGFTPNSTVLMKGYASMPNYQNGAAIETVSVAISINAAGTATWNNHTIDDGTVPRGTAAGWFTIPSMNVRSNTVTTIYGGTDPNAKPVVAINFTSSQIALGQSSSLVVNVSNLNPGTTYSMTFYRRSPQTSSFVQYYNTSTFTPNGTTHTGSIPIGNDGETLNGTADFYVTVTSTINSNATGKSNNASINYIVNRSISLVMNNTTSSSTIKVGTSVPVVMTFQDFPVAGSVTNSRINFVLEITGGENREAGGLYVTTNSVGRATATINNTLLGDDRIRGNVTYRLRATYYTLEGEAKLVYSNFVTINWIS